MNSLTDQIDAVISAENLSWERSGKLVDVELWTKGRRQKVHLDRKGEMYRFWSIVAGAGFVTRDEGAWRDLAYRAWRKNDLKEIVTFPGAGHNDHQLFGSYEEVFRWIDNMHRHTEVVQPKMRMRP